MSATERLAIAPAFNPSAHAPPILTRKEDVSYELHFDCMASDCVVFIESSDVQLVHQATMQAVIEAWRIEHKYSRYQKHNTFERIHSQPDRWQTLDDETTRMMIFAHQAFQASDGLFDITSGLLRQAWTFDGSDNLPTETQIKTLLQRIGWSKLGWSEQSPNQLKLPAGMELDFGGIGKEYAVDRVLAICCDVLRAKPHAVLVNFGGDLACSGRRLSGENWRIGVESITTTQAATHIIELSSGALATSGDTKRYLLKDGIRYSHVLNPKTGWSITDAASSVTVAAPTCVNAGIIATIASLQGLQCEHFLESLNMPHWVAR